MYKQNKSLHTASILLSGSSVSPIPELTGTENSSHWHKCRSSPQHTSQTLTNPVPRTANTSATYLLLLQKWSPEQ